MKRARRLMIGSTLITLTMAVVLLLNITAPNPTGRRYSSQVIDPALNAHEKGFQGEMILSKDLGVPRNELGARQCFCTTQYPHGAACNSCAAEIRTLSENRRPDFFTDTYIAEVKNHNDELYNRARDMEQIRDYVIGALVIDRPLWVYTRVDVPIPDDMRTLVRSTGGDIIPYLAVPGYVDETDQFGWSMLGVSLVILVILLLWELNISRFNRPAPRPVSVPRHKVIVKVEDMDEFARKVKDKAQGDIDQSDSWLDQK